MQGHALRRRPEEPDDPLVPLLDLRVRLGVVPVERRLVPVELDDPDDVPVVVVTHDDPVHGAVRIDLVMDVGEQLRELVPLAGAGPLSRERLVAAAIEILDAEGEGALTFRLLAARLATGPGALYHHVAGKDELLTTAAAHLLTEALDAAPRDGGPTDAIRSAAVAVFDALDAHPWIGAQLAREQFAAGARVLGPRTDRAAFLRDVAARWEQLDPDAFPFLHDVAAGLEEHDDRAQFIAGVDIVIAGIPTR